MIEGKMAQNGAATRWKTTAVSAHGFTLLEVILVVIIISLVLAVSYPSLSRGSTALRLRTTGRDVVNTLRTAREKAVTEQKEMRVVTDRNAQKILLTDEFGEGARVYALPHGIKIERMILAGREVLDGPMVIRFLSNGSCENAEITLLSDKGSSLRISADPITGAARIIMPVTGAGQP
jgi:general secretion pathway protein H